MFKIDENHFVIRGDYNVKNIKRTNSPTLRPITHHSYNRPSSVISLKRRPVTHHAQLKPIKHISAPVERYNPVFKELPKMKKLEHIDTATALAKLKALQKQKRLNN